MKLLILTLALVLSLSFAIDASEPQYSDLIPVSNLDLVKYGGVWYEIALFPYFFERDCYCTFANYTLHADQGYVGVNNTCNRGSPDSKAVSAVGKAFPVDPVNGTITTGKLSVEFFPGVKAPYYVIDLDENYQWALVGSPNRRYCWILSRSTSMSDDLYKQLADKAKSLEFDISNFKKIEQGSSCARAETNVKYLLRSMLARNSI